MFVPVTVPLAPAIGVALFSLSLAGISTPRSSQTSDAGVGSARPPPSTARVYNLAWLVKGSARSHVLRLLHDHHGPPVEPAHWRVVPGSVASARNAAAG